MIPRCPTCGGAVEVVTADEGTSSYRPSRPHLLTDEMVERAARALHEVSDDVLPFDLSVPKGMGRIHDRGRQQFIVQRRERYLTAARDGRVWRVLGPATLRGSDSLVRVEDVATGEAEHRYARTVALWTVAA